MINKKLKRGFAASLVAAMAVSSLAACSNSSSSGAGSTDGSKDAQSEAPASSEDSANNGGEFKLPELPEKKEDYKKKDVTVNTGDGEGKVLNIYCWNTEFQSRVIDYMPGYTHDDKTGEGKIGDVTVRWNITPSDNNAYQDNLDAALKAQKTAADDDKIDLFLVEADYASKYVDTDYTLDVKELGLTDADLSNMYDYTKKIVTTEDGKTLKGVSWQATPGLFAYRRSIAKDVLGTDDPDKVQEALSSWDKFDEVAAKAKDKGYFMLSGYDDAYRTFSNNMKGPWVQDGKVVIDDNIKAWVDQTKEYTDKGYNNGTSLWATEWAKDQGPEGKVFGFFYSTWGINFTLLGNSLETAVADGGKEEVGNGAYGDYAVCYGPQAYYWGGTWICGATDTDNKTLVKEIMYYMTCDPEISCAITTYDQDYTNNAQAMEAIAKSDFKSNFLGGQNHIALFTESAKKIDMSNICKYDQGCNEKFQAAMKNYFIGEATYEEALEQFKKDITTKYPALKMD